MPTEPHELPDVQQLAELATADKLFAFSHRHVRDAIRDPHKPLVLDHLPNAAMIRGALHSETSADVVLRYALSGNLAKLFKTSVGVYAPNSKSHDLAARLRGQVIDQVMTIIEQQHNPELAARAVANMLETIDEHEIWVQTEQMSFENDRSKVTELARYQETLLRDLTGQIRKVSTLPPELSGPDSYVQLMQQIHAKTHAPADVKDLATASVANGIRDQFCRQWFGKDHDGYAVEEFRASALTTAQLPVVRGALQNEIGTFSGIDRHPTWHRFASQQEFPETGVADYPQAIIDSNHPQHSRATRIFSLLLAGTTPRDNVGLALSMAAFGSDVTEMKQGQTLIRGMIAPATTERLEIYQTHYDRIYGAAAAGITERARQLIVAAASGTNPNWQRHIPLLQRRPEISIDTLQRPDRRPELHVIEAIAQSNEHSREIIPELTAEQEAALTALSVALADDIRESTIALPTMHNNDTLDRLVIRPRPDQFPASDIEAQAADYKVVAALDIQLNCTPQDDSQRARQLTVGLRALALAALHDEVLAVQQIKFAEHRHTTAVETKSSDDQPKPTRVHKGRHFIVIGAAAEDERLVQHTIQPSSEQNTVMLTVDRRPHWSDRAPQLTVEARRFAVRQWLNEADKSAVVSGPLLEHALTQPEAHRLSIRRILEGLMQQERRGQKILSNTFPLHQTIERLTTLADDQYQVLLTAYVGEDKAVGPLPNIYTMDQRMKADLAKMTELGIKPMSMPGRQRETETYMPFSRYETPIHLSTSGTGHVRQYTVLRGASATEAVRQLLRLPSSPQPA